MKNNEFENKMFGQLSEEELNQVSGGEEIIDPFAQYLQKNGTYRYVCTQCGEVITGKTRDEFIDAYYDHLGTHINMGNILDFKIPNFYQGGN